MARPKPQVLLTKQADVDLQFDILAAESLYMVVYKQQAFNFKKTYWNIKGPITKYHKVAFPSPAPAENLCKKLNQQFDCDDFTVRKIV